MAGERRRSKEAVGREGVSLNDLWPYLRPHRVNLLIAVLLSLFATVSSVVQPLIVAYLVDGAGADRLSKQSGVYFGGAILGLLIAGALFTALRQWILERASEKLVYSLRREVTLKVLSMPMSELDRRSKADIVSRVTTDVYVLRGVLGEGLVDLIASCLTIIAAVGFMAALDFTLLLIVLGVCAAIVFAMVVLGMRTRPVAYELQNRVGSLASRLERAVSAIRTVRANTATEFVWQDINEHTEETLRLGFLLARLRASVSAFTGVSIQAILLSVVGLGAWRVSQGAMSVGEFSAFVMYVLMVVSPLAMLAGVVTQIGEALGSLARVKEILDLPDEPHFGTVREIEPRPEAPAVQFSGVTFGYRPGPSTLREVSFTVESGKRIAIVGPSGAGKTTVFSLIERFYEPASGEIRLWGTSHRATDRESFRQCVGYVEQDAPVLAGTIRENLTLGLPRTSDDMCLRFLQRVGLIAAEDDEGKRMLDRNVGDGGVLLSGGERQRLAVARALMAGRKILLLDEATSHLDDDNELRVQSMLDSLGADVTVLTIAHRLATVRSADQILVVQDGKVVSSGTHEELLVKNELYAQMVARQGGS